MIKYENIIENEFEKDFYEIKCDEIVRYLQQFGGTDFWKIIKSIGGSERRILRLLDEMCNMKLIRYDIKLKKYYVTKVTTYKDYYCTECEGKRVQISALNDMSVELKRIYKNKPKPTFYFDQRPVNIETTIRRVAYLLSNGDVINKKIVMLGDDDLTSIALALLKLPCEVVALDIDERLINYINDVAEKYKLNLKAYIFNALDEVPLKLKNKFNVLMTDPTPEKIPFTVFMNKSIDLIENKSGILYTSIYSSAMSKSLDLQRVITNMNLYITDIIPRFTEYKSIYELYTQRDLRLFEKYNIKYDDKSICFTESLFRMELTDETKKIPIKYKGSDIFGKATKRVVKDKRNDIRHTKKEDEYFNKLREDIKSLAEKHFYSE